MPRPRTPAAAVKTTAPDEEKKLSPVQEDYLALIYRESCETGGSARGCKIATRATSPTNPTAPSN